MTRDNSPTRVLLVEDTFVNQQVAMRMLAKIGIEVELAKNGAEAVEALQREAFDLVLMDCEMPTMDGFEATAAIRALEGEASGVTIIAMTAHFGPEEERRCRAAGMDDFVAKPLRLDALRTLVGA